MAAIGTPQPASRWPTLASLAWTSAILVAAMLLAMFYRPVVATALAVALCAWAVRGPYWAIQALLIATLLKYLSPALIILPAEASLLTWVVAATAVARMVLARNPRRLRRLLPVALFAAIALVTSAISSHAVAVSAAKAVSFFLIVGAVLVATDTLEEEQSYALLGWTLTIVAMTAALSLATLARPAIAFYLNETGLQGILSHPQTLGVLLAPIVSALLVIAVLDSGGIVFTQWSLTALTLFPMLLTEARTAAIAAAGGVVLAMFPVGTTLSRNLPRGATARAVVTLLLCGGLLFAYEVNTGRLGPAVSAFILKHGASSAQDALLNSRGVGAVAEFRNFLARPIAGNGFGVYADGSFPNGISYVGGVPLSAPVEKGFLPSAVLEETGVFGALAFLLICWDLWRRVRQSQSHALVAVFVCCLLINIGECSLLSPGGIGLYLWILMGVAARSGAWPGTAIANPPPGPAPATDAGHSFPNLLR